MREIRMGSFVEFSIKTMIKITITIIYFVSLRVLRGSNSHSVFPCQAVDLRRRRMCPYALVPFSQSFDQDQDFNGGQECPPSVILPSLRCFAFFARVNPSFRRLPESHLSPRKYPNETFLIPNS